MIAISIIFWIGTLIVVPLVIVWLPADYLADEDRSLVRERIPSIWRYPYLILKNIFGVLFIVAGLAMLVLPGQGILTLVLGLALIDFPGKHRAIQRILGQRRVLAGINRLRARAKKPPLEKPPAAA